MMSVLTIAGVFTCAMAHFLDMNSSLWQKAYGSNLFLDNMPPFMHTFLNWPTYFSCIRNVVGLHG